MPIKNKLPPFRSLSEIDDLIISGNATRSDLGVRVFQKENKRFLENIVDGSSEKVKITESRIAAFLLSTGYGSRDELDTLFGFTKRGGDALTSVKTYICVLRNKFSDIGKDGIIQTFDARFHAMSGYYTKSLSSIVARFRKDLGLPFQAYDLVLNINDSAIYTLSNQHGTSPFPPLEVQLKPSEAVQVRKLFSKGYLCLSYGDRKSGDYLTYCRLLTILEKCEEAKIYSIQRITGNIQASGGFYLGKLEDKIPKMQVELGLPLHGSNFSLELDRQAGYAMVENAGFERIVQPIGPVLGKKAAKILRKNPSLDYEELVELLGPSYFDCEKKYIGYAKGLPVA